MLGGDELRFKSRISVVNKRGAGSGGWTCLGSVGSSSSRHLDIFLLSYTWNPGCAVCEIYVFTVSLWKRRCRFTICTLISQRACICYEFMYPRGAKHAYVVVLHIMVSTAEPVDSNLSNDSALSICSWWIFSEVRNCGDRTLIVHSRGVNSPFIFG